MTTPQEKARIEATLRRLQEEFEALSEGGTAPLRIRSSPHAVDRIKELSRDLKLLSGSHEYIDKDAT